MKFIEKKELIPLGTLLIFIIFHAYSILTGFSSTCMSAQISVALSIIVIPIFCWRIWEKTRKDQERHYFTYSLVIFIILLIIYVCIEKMYGNCFRG